jgi:hypothetical protein
MAGCWVGTIHPPGPVFLQRQPARQWRVHGAERRTRHTISLDLGLMGFLDTKMYDYLHASTRTSNPTQWEKDLEPEFDVDGFLKYLAVNTTIQNWDTYGRMTHNYYLYNDPAMGIL